MAKSCASRPFFHRSLSSRTFGSCSQGEWEREVMIWTQPEQVLLEGTHLTTTNHVSSATNEMRVASKHKSECQALVWVASKHSSESHQHICGKHSCGWQASTPQRTISTAWQASIPVGGKEGLLGIIS
eukprot:1142851-Pelagomonas_calceolata.AAC.9